MTARTGTDTAITDKLKSGNPANRGGRPKGSVNKTTAAIKEIISGAVAEMGGQARMVAWAKEDPANERAFWAQIVPKLLPLQVAGDKDNPITHEIAMRIVDVGAPD